MTEVNWNPGWLITRGILGQKSARSSLLRTHTPIHNVKKRALGHFSKLVNMIQCFEESSLNPKIMSMNDAFYCCRPVLESLHEMIRITTAPPAPPLTDWHSCLVHNSVLSPRQAGEGLGVGCGTGEPTARPSSAPEEAAEGAELWLLPAQDAGSQFWSIFSDRHPVYHIPRCLYVRHPPGA